MKVLEIAGDRGVTYQQVVSAIDVAHAAGVVEVAIRPRDR
jgi:biopolymer transport protein ExbD